MRLTPSGTTGPVDMDKVDLFDPWFYAEGDPHAVWSYMRAHAPLHRQVLSDGRAFWSVTRYQDACRVLGNHREFTSERGSLVVQLGHGDAAAGKMLVATDPPRHSELRRPLNAMFSPKELAAHEAKIRTAAKLVLAPARHGDEWDLARQALMLPMAVAGFLMDLPERDWADLVEWTAMSAAPEDPDYRRTNGSATLAIAHHHIFEYFSQQVATRRATVGEDAIRLLLSMRAGGRTLSDEEAVVNCYSLLLGANATTPHTVSGTILALMEYPRQRDAVREHRLLIPAARPGPIATLVEEGLRWTSPANSFLRHSRQEVELSGGVVPAGDAVAVWVGSANRDERVFVDPHQFDLARSDNRHIAFGFGPHYCLGAAVARLTLRVFFEEAFELIEEFQPAGAPRHLVSNFVAGFASLPVRTRLRRRR